MTDQQIIELDELESNASTAMVVASLAQQAALPREVEDGLVYAVVNPEGGIDIVDTPLAATSRADARADGPHRIIREMLVRDVDSFLDVIGQTNADDGGDAVYLPDGSRGILEVWADLDKRTITAIHDGYDGWRDHTTILQLRHSVEWADWARIDGQMMDQVDFAEFIEDHLSSIGEPDGAALLEICQTLQARTGVQFKQQSILANGQRTFAWEEDTQARAGQKGDMKIPGELTLVLRPFQGAAQAAVTARFRFRIQPTGLQLGIRLVERERILEDAFNAIVDGVQDGIPVKVRFGRG